MEHETSYTAFAGTEQVATGPLPEVLPILKERFDADRGESVLVFGDETGRQIDFDLRAPIDQILERECPTPTRGRGRPRLGVKSREITLLPRHWSWLKQQPRGISATVRRLVDGASKVASGQERGQQVRNALSQVLSAIAGDLPHFEEACRALFARDTPLFESTVIDWPADIRAYARRRNGAADVADRESPVSPNEAKSIVADLYQRIWSEGDYSAIGQLVAPSYTVHSDPGDAWEGQSLDQKTYEERVLYSRRAFPDLVFTLEELLAADGRVSVRWKAEGTQLGDLVGLPATGKRLHFAGQTIYQLDGAHVAGHWQVVNRLGFIEQLR